MAYVIRYFLITCSFMHCLSSGMRKDEKHPAQERYDLICKNLAQEFSSADPFSLKAKAREALRKEKKKKKKAFKYEQKIIKKLRNTPAQETYEWLKAPISTSAQYSRRRATRRVWSINTPPSEALIPPAHTYRSVTVPIFAPTESVILTNGARIALEVLTTELPYCDLINKAEEKVIDVLKSLKKTKPKKARQFLGEAFFNTVQKSRN